MDLRAATQATTQARVSALDIGLFDGVTAQLSSHDKRSLLAIQATVGERCGTYSYLEIGSYLGGSLQPHLLDDRCRKIYSVDKRVTQAPDAARAQSAYPANSTKLMQATLFASTGDISKLRCIDGDASAISPEVIEDRPALCFIDGEHTDTAVIRDYRFCRTVAADSSVICFHDADIVYGGLNTILEDLKSGGISFQAYNLPDRVFVIELGIEIHRDARVATLLVENHLGYLHALKGTSHYRAFYYRRSVRAFAWLARTFRRPWRALFHGRA